jgi:hypothetical protein
MVLYHRTSIVEARAVVQRGFEDQKWGFEVDAVGEERRLKLLGVWLSDRVLEEGDGPPGDAILEVTVRGDADVLQPFEVSGVVADGRLWVVPAAALNRMMTARIFSVDPRTSWRFKRSELGDREGETQE